MKILVITHGGFLDPIRIASGNSVRAYHLAKGLVHFGYEVTYVSPRELEKSTGGEIDSAERHIRVRTYGDRDGLARLLAEERPGLLLVGYWELLDDLPEQLSVPVIVDLVAPRILEVIFDRKRGLSDEVRHMLRAYRKADRFLVGNERQRHFLLSWLILAGFDCRNDVPIDVVPISASPGHPHKSASISGTNFVSGGVSWPWRQTGRWFDVFIATLRTAAERRGRFVLFSGRYIYSSDPIAKVSAASAERDDDVIQRRSLLPYGEMQQFLEEKCEVGVELADWNVEREYSQSFRAIEFLRAGLPVICNKYLELASLIERYDAGWVVDSPEELPTLVREILDNPESRILKSANAIRLVEDRFHFLKTIQPIIKFADHPIRPIKAEPLLSTESRIAPVKGTANSQGLLHWMARKLLWVAQKLAKAIRPKSGEGIEIAIITRADIFPTVHGAAVKIDRTAASLSNYVDAVYLITDDRSRYFVYQKGSARQETYPFWVRWLTPPRPVVWLRTLASGIPLSNAFLYFPLFDWSYISRSCYLALRHPITVFQAEFPAYARACVWGRKIFGGKVLLVEHNVEYSRIEEQTADLSPAAYEYLRRVEVRLCNESDAVITVSERDRDQLIEDGVRAKCIHHIPHGVDLTQFDAARAFDVRNKYGIPANQPLLVYHGTYAYPPNLEAIQVLAERVLPLLRQRGFELKVLAIGPYPPTSSPHEDIIFTGPVDVVAPYLLAADIAVVPLMKGGGTRMKILDYFAASLPVVSSAKGIEGIPAINGVHALVVGWVGEAFADAIEELLTDRAKARHLGRQGRLFVEQMDWNVIARRYLDLIAEGRG